MYMSIHSAKVKSCCTNWRQLHICASICRQEPSVYYVSFVARLVLTRCAGTKSDGAGCQGSALFIYIKLRELTAKKKNNARKIGTRGKNRLIWTLMLHKLFTYNLNFGCCAAFLLFISAAHGKNLRLHIAARTCNIQTSTVFKLVLPLTLLLIMARN